MIQKEQINDIILNYSDYAEAYLEYQRDSQNLMAVLWLIYLSIPALLGILFPAGEIYFLVIFFGIGILLMKSMKTIAYLIMKIYLNKINKKYGDKVFLYEKTNKIIKQSLLDVLRKGSTNFHEEVLSKVLKELNL